MALNKPKFWNIKNHFLSIILIPLSLVYKLLLYLKKNFSGSHKFKIPIICVGNIYVGGTGKTPFAIFIANKLTKKNKNPAILKKEYKDQYDEQNLIKKYFKNLVVKKDRIDGIIEVEKLQYDSVILDDGLQDYKIKKDLKIVCFNERQQIGNGLVFPSGPLREDLSSLSTANIIIINGEKNSNFEKQLLKFNDQLEIFYSRYIPKNIDIFLNKKLLAFAGIGNPENFFELLDKNKLFVEKKLIFPDHYEFNKNEIIDIIKEAKEANLKIITTEKDYCRIKKFELSEIDFLRNELQIHEDEKLIERVLEVYDKKN